MAARFWVGGTGTWDATDTTHWAATSGGASGVSVPGSADTVTLDGSSGGGTVTVNTDFSITSLTMGAFTGTLDFATNNNNPTMQTFSGTGTGARTLNMGNGTWTLTGGGSVTIWNTAVTTSFTLNYGSAVINATYSGSTGFRNLQSADSSTFAIPPINITAGTDVIRTNGNAASFHCKSISFVGFTGSWDLNNSFNSQNFYGDFTLGTGMTFTNAGAGKILNFKNTGAQSITTNGVVIKAGVTINGTGNVTTLQDNLDMTFAAAAMTLTLTAGTLNANNKNVTCTLFNASGSTTRVLTMGSGTWTLLGTGTIWDTSTSTNLTLNANTSVLAPSDVSASTKTLSFAAGNTLATLTIPNNSAGAYIFNSGGTYTVGTFNFGTGTTHTFQASRTIQFTNAPNLGGSVGNVITINSGSAGTAAIFSYAGAGQVNGTYLSIQDNTPTQTFTWYAGHNSTQVSNTGNWLFGVPYFSSQTATLSHTGAFTKKPIAPLTASLSFVGGIGRAISAVLTATASTTGSVVKAIRKQLTGQLSFSGAFRHGISHALTAVLSFSGNIAPSYLRYRVMTAVMSYTGGLRKSARRSLAGTFSISNYTFGSGTFGNSGDTFGLGPTDSLIKQTNRPILAGVTYSGLMIRQLTKTLGASALSFVGAMTRRLGRSHASQLSTTGNISKSTRRSVAGTVSFTGVWSESRLFFKAVTGVLSFSGTMSRVFRKTLTASLSIVGNFRKFIIYGSTKHPTKWTDASHKSPAVWVEKDKDPTPWRPFGP